MTIESICKKITELISIVRTPLNAIPAALIVCGAINRPGLSPMLVAANIIRRMNEAGIVQSEFTKVSEAMERIRAEELFKAIKTDMRIEVGIPVGGIQFQGTGANAGGPVEVAGFNINPVHGDGIAR